MYIYIYIHTCIHTYINDMIEYGHTHKSTEQIRIFMAIVLDLANLIAINDNR